MRVLVAFLLSAILLFSETIEIPLTSCTKEEAIAEAKGLPQTVEIKGAVRKVEGAVSAFREETIQSPLTFVGVVGDGCERKGVFYRESLELQEFKPLLPDTDTDTTVLEKYRSKNLKTQGQGEIKEFQVGKLLDRVQKEARTKLIVTGVEETKRGEVVSMRLDVTIPPDIVKEWMTSYAQFNPQNCSTSSWTMLDPRMSQDAVGKVSIDEQEKISYPSLGYSCKEKGFPRLRMSVSLQDGESPEETRQREMREYRERLDANPSLMYNLRYSLGEDGPVSEEYIYNVYIPELFPVTSERDLLYRNGGINSSVYPITYEFGTWKYSLEYKVIIQDVRNYRPYVSILWSVETHEI